MIARALVVLAVFAFALRASAADLPSVALPDDSATLAAHDAKLTGMLAVATTPKHFPNHTPADSSEMFKRAAELGKGAVFIFQWSDPALNTLPAWMLSQAKDNGLTAILGLSPTTLDQARRKIDAPAALQKPTLSFGDAEVKSAFIFAAEKLAALKPPYLCLATEINFYALNGAQECVSFAALYKDAYRAVKKISPVTKVYVSFQYEFLRRLDHDEPSKLDEHRKLIDIFRPELDLVAITTYPADYYDDPAKIPANYYSHLLKYLKPDDSVMVMEIGWPASATDTRQRAFVLRLPALLGVLAPRVTAWSMLHDVKVPQFGPNLATTGLFTNEGEAKSAVQAWKELSRDSK